MVIDTVKVALRTMTTDEGINAQIQLLIDSCVDDLKSAQIKVEKDSNGNYSPMITNAIIVYVKAFFYPEKNEDFFKAYLSMKTQLALLQNE